MLWVGEGASGWGGGGEAGGFGCSMTAHGLMSCGGGPHYTTLFTLVWF